MMPNDDVRRTGARYRATPGKPERRRSACVVGEVLRKQFDVPAVEAVLAAVRRDDRPIGVGVGVIGAVPR